MFFCPVLPCSQNHVLQCCLSLVLPCSLNYVLQCCLDHVLLCFQSHVLWWLNHGLLCSLLQCTMEEFITLHYTIQIHFFNFSFCWIWGHIFVLTTVSIIAPCSSSAWGKLKIGNLSVTYDRSFSSKIHPYTLMGSYAFHLSNWPFYRL